MSKPPESYNDDQDNIGFYLEILHWLLNDTHWESVQCRGSRCAETGKVLRPSLSIDLFMLPGARLTDEV